MRGAVRASEPAASCALSAIERRAVASRPTTAPCRRLSAFTVSTPALAAVPLRVLSSALAETKASALSPLGRSSRAPSVAVGPDSRRLPAAMSSVPAELRISSSRRSGVPAPRSTCSAVVPPVSIKLMGVPPSVVPPGVRRPPISTLPAPLPASEAAAMPSVEAGVLPRSSTKAKRLADTSSVPARPPTARACSWACQVERSLPVVAIRMAPPSSGSGGAAASDKAARLASNSPVSVSRTSLRCVKTAGDSTTKRSPGVPGSRAPEARMLPVTTMPPSSCTSGAPSRTEPWSAARRTRNAPDGSEPASSAKRAGSRV